MTNKTQIFYTDIMGKNRFVTTENYLLTEAGFQVWDVNLYIPTSQVTFIIEYDETGIVNAYNPND